MENYLMLNGKRIDLTEEQIRTLGLETKEDYFSRYGDYYYIGASDRVFKDYEDKHANCKSSELRYNTGNYCKNEELLKQRALHETLDRLLWRFSMQNDGDKIDWNDLFSNKYFIYYDVEIEKYEVNFNHGTKRNTVYFHTREIAQKAMDEISEIRDLKPRYVFLTHAHVDHMWGINSYVEAGAEVLVSQDDAKILSDEYANCAYILKGELNSYNGSYKVIKENGAVVEEKLISTDTYAPIVQVKKVGVLPTPEGY